MAGGVGKKMKSPAKLQGSPNRGAVGKASGKREEVFQAQKSKKRVDYSDKIKEL